jgi:type II secretory pathway component GspD/PulD (secretin)
MRFGRSRATFAALLLGLAVGPAGAQAPVPAQPQPGQSPAQQPAQQPPQQPPPQPFVFVPPGPRVDAALPQVELAPLLERVARASSKRFLVDGSVGPRIYLAGVEANDVTYPLLLSILRANGLAAVEIDGRVNIVRDTEVRFLPARIVQTDDASLAADEWVTRVVTVVNIEAPLLIPILRPLLPQGAHLAALPPNRIILVDRYANVQRITAIIGSLDTPTPARD